MNAAALAAALALALGLWSACLYEEASRRSQHTIILRSPCAAPVHPRPTVDCVEAARACRARARMERVK